MDVSILTHVTQRIFHLVTMSISTKARRRTVPIVVIFLGDNLRTAIGRSGGKGLRFDIGAGLQDDFLSLLFFHDLLYLFSPRNIFPLVCF